MAVTCPCVKFTQNNGIIEDYNVQFGMQFEVCVGNSFLSTGFLLHIEHN